MGEQRKTAKQFVEERGLDPAKFTKAPCPHCGTGSKFHPVNAQYCEAYETDKIAALESTNARLVEACEMAIGFISTECADNSLSQIVIQDLRAALQPHTGE